MAPKAKQQTGVTPAQGLEARAALSRAAVQLRAGRLQEAEAEISAALSRVPGHVELLAALGELRLRQGRASEALEPLRKAAKKAPKALALQNNLATALRLCKEPGEAEKVIRRALARAPRDAAALAPLEATLGAILQDGGKPDKALPLFEKALAAQPGNRQLLVSLGVCLRDLGCGEEALSAFDRALSIKSDAEPGAEPGLASAHYQKLLLLERASRLDEAEAAARAALEAAASHAGVVLTAARLWRRLGRRQEAAALLENLQASGDYAYERGFQLGRLYDELDRGQDAFAAFAEANRLQAATPLGRAARKERFLERIACLENTVSAEWLAGWREPDGPADPFADGLSDPLFLVGFPRSGTTLLDQILSGHSQIEVIEEQPLLEALRRRLDEREPGYPQALAILPAKEIGRLRKRYAEDLSEALAASGCSGKTACRVDKFPLNLLDLPLVQRLFPRARVILALRHPCDVVLSCFMQQFRLNNAMAHFLDLEDAARLYARVMALGRRYEDLLELPIHRLRYEDLVSDSEGQMRALLDFLGLDWEPSMLDHVATAKSRRIATPSYEQVTQPIYSHASGRWRRYETHLKPLLPLLRPSIEAFGYADEGE